MLSSASPGPGTPPGDLLLQCRGRPVRASLFDPVYRDRLGRYPGVLAEVSAECLQIECLDLPASAAPGTRVTLEVMCGGQVLWCHSHLLPGSDQLPRTLRLAWPDDIQTVQRRNWPRIEAYVPIHYLIEGTRTPVQGMMVDIGGGGARIRSAAPLAPGQVVSLVFSLGSGLFFQDITAEVLRAIQTRSGAWEAGLRFRGLTSGQERQLTEYVNQRIAARRGSHPGP